jgi:hypothetical protein
MTDQDEPVIRLVRWPGPWDDDDPHANLKADVALYSRLDPLKTLKGLSGNVAGITSCASCAICREAHRAIDSQARPTNNTNQPTPTSQHHQACLTEVGPTTAELTKPGPLDAPRCRL